MTTSRLLALLALLCFLGFLAVFVIRVPRLDLSVVVSITLLLVIYDLWLQLGPRRR